MWLALKTSAGTTIVSLKVTLRGVKPPIWRRLLVPSMIRGSGFGAFPPRLPAQPIFYPVLSEEYAVKIARDWNVKASGAGYVTRFQVLTSFLAAYEVQTAGGSAHLEYWIPAQDLDAFNAAILGPIEVVAAFGQSEGDR